MDFLSREELKSIIGKREFPSLSLYMPARRAGADIRENPIRFKNLLRIAEERLEEAGLRRPEAKKILEQAWDILPDDIFWQHQSDGLALFIAPDFFQFYRLPLAFEELVVTGEKFHTKPLLPLFQNDGRFFILALSQAEVRMFESTRYQVEQLDLDRVPSSLAEALKYDDPEQSLQHHTSEGGERGSTAGPAVAMFHGHADEAEKTNILRFFQNVDRGLQEVLGEERIPVVLAGVEYLLPIFREASAYPYLVDEAIIGNPERMPEAELHTRAWEIVAPYFQRGQKQAAELFQRLAGKETRRASSDVGEVVQAAFHGRVEQLLIPQNETLWGSFDPDSGQVEINKDSTAGSQDLYDYIATHTILNGGSVYAVQPDELPEETHFAAIFRY